MADKRYGKQDIDNQGADPTFNGFPMREMVGYDDSVSPARLRRIHTDSQGNVIQVSGISLKPFDYMSRDLTDSVTETYTFKSGGSSGTTTNTMIIVYTDSTLNTILSITKT